MTEPSGERQLTFGSPNKDLDNNLNFSPDGRFLVFDCRDERGIGPNGQLGKVDVHTGEVTIFYRQNPVVGVGAASFLNNGEVVAIHGIPGLSYDFTVRGGMIIAADGSGKHRWLDSRDVHPPFTAGALRGGTHKHEPDSTGEWIGFTYNDRIMKLRGSDLRNVGVSRRGIKVAVDSGIGNFTGESFSVLLTACVENPRPDSDEISRAEFDCWVGRRGYPVKGGFRRAMAFVGTVAGGYKDLFLVDVPADLTKHGPLGTLQGNATDYPKPPAGAIVRRLTYTANHKEVAMRGISGHPRASGDGRWIAYVARALRGSRVLRRTEYQLLCISPTSPSPRQLSFIPGGVVGSPAFSPDSRFVVARASDGGVLKWSTDQATWGTATILTDPNPYPATNLIVSPDSRIVAFNREIDRLKQIFAANAAG